MATTRLYKDGKLAEKDFPVDRISDYKDQAGYLVWADFTSPTEEDLAAIQEELGLHRLAIEDAVHEHQRPKLDRYDTHSFLAAYHVRFDAETLKVAKTEIKAFIAKNVVVTVHDKEFDMADVVERWDGASDLARYGSAFLVWGILDVVVDSQFSAVQGLDAETDDLEDALFDENPRDKEIERRSFALRKSLVMLRRAVVPMREVVTSVIRHETDNSANDRAMLPYFQDVFDHVLRTTEWTDTVRDLIATVLDTNVGLRANRMNLIMKKVTSWAAIIAVPTAITGFFGQNLQFFGFGTVWGVWLSFGLIVVTAALLYRSFKKRDWL